MAEIFFSSQLREIEEIVANTGYSSDTFRRVNGLQDNDKLAPFRAYTLDLDDQNAGAIVRHLNSIPQAERVRLSAWSAKFGNETNAIAEFCADNFDRETLESVNGLVGAGTSAAMARLSSFQKALIDFQEKLLRMQSRKKATSIGGPVSYYLAKQEVEEASRNLQKQFRAELGYYVNRNEWQKNRGTALSGEKRAITLANRRLHGNPDPRLFVADQVQAGRLNTFVKFIRGLGYTAIFSDIFIRSGKVRTAQVNGEDWLKESVKQVTGFGVGGALGGYAGDLTITAGTRLGGQAMAVMGKRLGGQLAIRAGLAATVGLSAAGPVGWVILGTVMAAGFYVGYQASQGGDHVGKSLASLIWDKSSG
ncbi:hypothetical protein ACFOZ5_00005 [Marinobacter lacisalsi]|uniref:Uncharacterized protein n=1 Tax=Marinobacter lacisalsi TaxID=475979 RepID=A0ABV8QAR8_9GAMM